MKLPSIIIPLFLLLVVTILSACAPVRWQPVTEKKMEIVWPSPPLSARVHYLGEISRFHQTGGNLLTSLIGKSQGGNIIKPVAVSVGPEDRLAIADQGRKGIHLYIPNSQQYRFIYEAGGEKIDTPVGLTFDNESRLYVTDAQLHKVLIFDDNGDFLFSIARAGQDSLERPTGILFNRFDKHLYVTDSLKHQILIFNLNGEWLGRIGSRGEKAGTFNFPTHLGLDYQGNIYITDSMNFRAQIFSPASGNWRQFGRFRKPAPRVICYFFRSLQRSWLPANFRLANCRPQPAPAGSASRAIQCRSRRASRRSLPVDDPT